MDAEKCYWGDRECLREYSCDCCEHRPTPTDIRHMQSYNEFPGRQETMNTLYGLPERIYTKPAPWYFGFTPTRLW